MFKLSSRLHHYIFLSIYFLPFSVSTQHAHSCVVEFQSQNRGYRDTRLCLYNFFDTLRYIPCLQFQTRHILPLRLFSFPLFFPVRFRLRP